MHSPKSPEAAAKAVSRPSRCAPLVVMCLGLLVPLQAWSAGCGVDGTLVRDAATRGQEAADRTVNQGAVDIMTAAQSRAACLERFGVQSIPPLGSGTGSALITRLANNALESACNQARGAASRYISQAQNAVAGAVNVNLPTISGASTGGIVPDVAQAAAQAVAHGTAAQQSVWARFTCYVAGNC